MPKARLQVLMVDDKTDFELPGESRIELHTLENIKTERSKKVYEKYYSDLNKFRWSMKSVFLSFLLDEFEKVIFLDPDINFFENGDFLFELLDTHNVLLTPHWRVADLRIPKNDMVRIYEHGIHNAGFVASNKNGKEAMNWWIDACLFKCEKDKMNGIWDDQSYLSIMHLFHEGVHILKHKGCNVSFWNYRYNKRVILNNQVLLGAKDPIIFIHFDRDTINKVNEGVEDYLLSHLQSYQERLGNNMSIYSLA